MEQIKTGISEILAKRKYCKGEMGHHSTIKTLGQVHQCHPARSTFEICHLKPVNEFSEFNEFILDTYKTITTHTDVMDHPCEYTTYGKLFFTLVVKTTHVRSNNLTMKSYCTTCVIFFFRYVETMILHKDQMKKQYL